MYQTGLRYILIAFTGAVLLGACEDENGTDADDASIPLSVAGENIKAPGKGQYRFKTLSSNTISVKADLSGVASIQSLTITKQINLINDTDFGNNGVLTVSPSSITDGTYTLVYKSDLEDLDQLVGFTFHAEDQNGKVIQSDLTLAVNLSPRDNIPRKKWLWTSRLWVDNGNSQDLKECEKDNFFLFNSDGSITVNYASGTGAGDCAFEGFKIYDNWQFTEDEKFFIVKKHDAFSGVVEIDSFRVQSLTQEKMLLELDIDLSVFGLSTEETFLYEYTAQPK